MGATDTSQLPDYAPIPDRALGPALNAQGCYVGRVDGNLYWITDGAYQSAFLTEASSLFDRRVTRIGHEETQRLLLRDDDPTRPPNEETFGDHHTLKICGERID